MKTKAQFSISACHSIGRAVCAVAALLFLATTHNSQAQYVYTTLSVPGAQRLTLMASPAITSWGITTTAVQLARISLQWQQLYDVERSGSIGTLMLMASPAAILWEYSIVLARIMGLIIMAVPIPPWAFRERPPLLLTAFPAMTSWDITKMAVHSGISLQWQQLYHLERSGGDEHVCSRHLWR